MSSTTFHGASHVGQSTARFHNGGARVIRSTRRVVRWFAADSRDVVRFTRAAAVGAGAPHLPSDGDLPGRPDLPTGLGRWQRAIALWRLVALLRRWAIGALIVALILAALGRLTSGVPGWAIVGAAVVVFVVGATASARRSITPLDVARLLDHRLALKEQLASALERRVAASKPGLLDPYLATRAAALVGQTRHEWTARPVAGSREWVAVVVMCVALSALGLAPRSVSSRLASGPRPAPPAALPIATSQGHGADVLPTVLPHTRYPVQVRVAVVSAPTANAADRPSGPNRRAQLQHRGAQTTTGQNSAHNPAGRGTRTSANGPAGTATAAAAGATAQPTPERHTLPFIPGNHSTLPVPQRAKSGASGKGTGAARRGTVTGRQPAAARPGQANGKGTSTSRPGSASASNAKGPARAGAGKARSPYGGPLPGIGARPTPGLIVGKALYSGTHLPPSGSAAGRGRGATHGQAVPHRTLHSAPGHQLSLRSPYNGGQRGTQQSGSPGKGEARSAHVNAGQGETQGTDYVAPDANAVAPGDRAVVTHYFTPRATS